MGQRPGREALADRAKRAKIKNALRRIQSCDGCDEGVTSKKGVPRHSLKRQKSPEIRGFYKKTGSSVTMKRIFPYTL